MGAPLRSMTGAGEFVLETERGRLEVEARSVNHRFLKTSVRLAGGLPAFDARVEPLVRGRLERGHLTVGVRLRIAGPAVTARIDAAGFAAAAETLRALAAEAGLPPPTLSDVLAAPGVVGEPSANGDDALAADFDRAVAGALDALVRSRETEGRLLATEMDALFGRLETAVDAVAERADAVPGLYRERLERRLEQLLEGREAVVDPAWLAREVALLAERADVTEELARIRAHVAHGRELLAAGGPAGRRLDFLAQELHREANTIGSKAADSAIARLSMDLKAEVERLREQVQNLE